MEIKTKNVAIPISLHSKLKRSAGGEKLYSFTARVIVAGLKAVKQERKS